MAVELSIPGGKDDFFNEAYDSFSITDDKATVYEWAMLLPGLHPYPRMYSIGDGRSVDGDDEVSGAYRLIAISRSQPSQKIYDAIRAAAAAGEITPVKPAKWYEDPPEDFTRCVFTAKDVASVLRKLGATGPRIETLLATYTPAGENPDQGPAPAPGPSLPRPAPRRRYGPLPEKRSAAEEKMRARINGGELTVQVLAGMKVVSLEKEFDAKRYTVTEARKNVLSEFNHQQTPNTGK